jgi:ParB family transcriptional regulator, chromosome partitioning protein
MKPITCNWGKARKACSSSGQALELNHETVRVSDVIVPKSHREVDEETASRIAESIRAHGFLGPIVVRRRQVVAGYFEDAEDTTAIYLVAGRNRLRGAELAGLKEIPAIFFKGDNRHARLVTIEENLFRKDLTALERAEQYAEWFRIAEQLKVSGQDVRKPKGGRPEGGVAKVARELPISRGTAEARRKTLERSIAIAGMLPKTKEAIKNAKLDNNQKAMLKIAEQGTPHAQAKKIRELQTTRETRRAAIKKRLRETMPASERTTYKELLAAWDSSPEFRKAWHRTPTELRERFINEVLRGPRDGGLDDAVELVKKALHGRKSILVQDMQRLGRRHGFDKKVIQNVIRGLGYKKKRLSWNRNHPWSYINTYKRWKDQLAVIPKEDFADLRPPEKRQTTPIAIDVNVDEDDDSELPERLSEPDFSDLD